MHAKTLHRFKEGGSDSEVGTTVAETEIQFISFLFQPGQQSKESASGLESEGSGASSEPTQVLFSPNPRSGVDRSSTGDGDNRWVAELIVQCQIF